MQRITRVSLVAVLFLAFPARILAADEPNDPVEVCKRAGGQYLADTRINKLTFALHVSQGYRLAGEVQFTTDEEWSGFWLEGTYSGGTDANRQSMADLLNTAYLYKKSVSACRKNGWLKAIRINGKAGQ